jgi:hypothetical protein
MGRAIVNKTSSPRLTQTNFSESSTSLTLGPPTSNATNQGEAVLPSANEVVSVNEWVAMTQADQGLLDAIYDFINTTKEGVSVIPNNLTGRTKKLFFNFYGTMGKSIKPGEIGQFEVNFSYPPVSYTDTSTASASA